VVIGALDPNPAHAGRAIALLESAGIEVLHGVLVEECAHLHRAFFRWITTGRPWVIAKAALSLDGRLSRPPGESRWLSSAASLEDAHRLRAEADAILVGANTLRTDDPRLTLRGAGTPEGKTQPWRVVLGGSGELPTGAQLFTDEFRDRTLVYRNQPLESVLEDLGARYQVQTLLIEGGAAVLGSFWDAQRVDEVCFYLTPWLCGGPTLGIGGLGAGASAEGARIVRAQYRRMGSDLRLTGLVERC
jgi:diaminohydroxyphosphoribosylaminopyrimidine deaminase/5-amino-6-(5-phosphoribosylamino)uracil reductase